MSADIEISVIICVKNGQDTIERQLRALAQQIDPPRFEIIVVNNRSTDETKPLVLDWFRAQASQDFDLKLIDADLYASIPYARNLGVRAARGKFLAFCDADDVVYPGWLRAFYNKLDKNILAGGKIIPVSGEIKDSGWGAGLFATSHLPHVGNGNCAISRETFMRLEGYDESLPRYGFEDVEFSWHAQQNGVELIYVPEAIISFYPSTAKSSALKKFHLGRGRVLMSRRFPQYDSSSYTVRETVRNLIEETLRFFVSTAKNRSLDRKRAGNVFSLLGRAAGAIQYCRPHRIPQRKGIVQ
ncbi:MAG: glycosyltransferase family A protein [Rothia sp. (in: high G+C Gram-positive bacteria)]|nr:glycosyltransferase family A protein [Rothia sp. (in: high G+C Gram-positive bacteria)]